MPEPSRDLTISIMPFISSVDKINIVVPDAKIFLLIFVSAADAAAVN